MFLTLFFNASVLFYISFYNLNVMVLIVKPYLKAYGFYLLNHILERKICFIKQASNLWF